MPKANHKTYKEYYGPAYGPETAQQYVLSSGPKLDEANKRIIEVLSKASLLNQKMTNEFQHPVYPKNAMDTAKISKMNQAFRNKKNPSTDEYGNLLSPDQFRKDNSQFDRFSSDDWDDARKQYSKAMAGKSISDEMAGPTVRSKSEETMARIRQKIMIDRIEKELDEANNF